jgi:hypothetical protein
MRDLDQAVHCDSDVDGFAGEPPTDVIGMAGQTDPTALAHTLRVTRRGSAHFDGFGIWRLVLPGDHFEGFNHCQLEPADRWDHADPLMRPLCVYWTPQSSMIL